MSALIFDASTPVHGTDAPAHGTAPATTLAPEKEALPAAGEDRATGGKRGS